MHQRTTTKFSKLRISRMKGSENWHFNLETVKPIIRAFAASRLSNTEEALLRTLQLLLYTTERCPTQAVLQGIANICPSTFRLASSLAKTKINISRRLEAVRHTHNANKLCMYDIVCNLKKKKSYTLRIRHQYLSASLLPSHCPLTLDVI